MHSLIEPSECLSTPKTYKNSKITIASTGNDIIAIAIKIIISKLNQYLSIIKSLIHLLSFSVGL